MSEPGKDLYVRAGLASADAVAPQGDDEADQFPPVEHTYGGDIDDNTNEAG